MSIELIEGSGREQLRHVIKSLGYNKDVDIRYATVTGAYPNTRIKIDNMPIELDADDLAICEHLTKHTRTVSISGGAETTIEFNAALDVGDRVVIASFNSDQQHVILDRLA